MYKKILTYKKWVKQFKDDDITNDELSDMYESYLKNHSFKYFDRLNKERLCILKKSLKKEE